MKLMRTVDLIKAGAFPNSADAQGVDQDILKGITAVEWPPNSGGFTIYPERKANGVKPIKEGMMLVLKGLGWELEKQVWPTVYHTVKGKQKAQPRPGKLDAIKRTPSGIFALEWETGNISSSHRALNKMAMGIKDGVLIGGALIVPTRDLYQYLTDRIGNYEELRAYLGFWPSIPCQNGLLQLIVIEHDAISLTVAKIAKGTDGRALI